MRKLLPLVLLLLWPVEVSAQIGAVPNVFTANTTISSSAVNANFSTVYAAALNRTGGTMTGTLTTQAIVPDGDNTRDIGSAALSYNDGWFDGTLTVATATITTGTITTLTSTSAVSAQAAFGTGAAISTGAIVNISGTFTGSGAGFGLAISPSVTVPSGTIGALLSETGTLIEAGSGTHSLLAAWRVMIPTITGGAAAVTNAATVYIEGEPTATVTGRNYALWVDSGTVAFDDGVQERGRTFDMGETQTRAFSAGNFTSDSGSWTVASGDVTTDSYRVIGDTLYWTIRLTATTTAGPPAQLRVTLPNSYTAAETAINVCATGQTSVQALVVDSLCTITSGNTYIAVTKANASTFTAASDDWNVVFQIVVKVS